MNTEFSNLAEANSFFLWLCPQIVDHLSPWDRYSGRHGPARVVEWNDEEEAHHVNECPDFEHDCGRNGCGRSWSSDYQFGATLEVWRHGEWREVRQFIQQVRGGMGL